MNAVKYQVFVNGQPIKKHFTRKDAFMNTTWNRFNRWAQTVGQATEYVEGDYLGGMAWVTKKGIAEIRKVDV